MTATVTPLKPRTERKETASEWLLRVGPIAKRLNEEARSDG